MEVKHRSNEKVLNYFAEVKGDASFLDFAGYDGLITEGEKAAAERGAAARGTYGAKRDRCKRGKSCGAACIFYRKDCVLDLPVNVSNAVSDMRNYLLRKVERGEMTVKEASKAFMSGTGFGNITNKRASLEKGGDKTAIKEMKAATGASGTRLAQRRAEITQAVREMKRDIPDKAERRQRYERLLNDAMEAGFGSKDQTSLPSKRYYDGVASEKQQQRLARMNEIEMKFRNGQITPEQYNREMSESMSWYRKRNVTDGEVRLMLAAVSPQAYGYLQTAGTSLAPNVYDGARPSSLAVTNGSTGKGTDVQKAWAWQNMRIMMETNFQDVYSRTRYRILGVDLEHLTPEEYAKAAANMGVNKSFAMSQVNQNRRSDDLSYFLKSNPNGFFSGLLAPNGSVNGEALRVQQEPYLRRMNVKDDIKMKRQTVRSLMETISQIPASELPAAQRNGLIKNIVSTWLGISGSATVGKEGRNDASWNWYGGKKNTGWSGANALAQRITTKLAEFEGQGDAGTRKMMALTGLMNNIQKSILEINNMQFNGAPVRNQSITGNKALKDLISKEMEARVKVQESLLNEILGP